MNMRPSISLLLGISLLLVSNASALNMPTTPKSGTKPVMAKPTLLGPLHPAISVGDAADKVNIMLANDECTIDDVACISERTTVSVKASPNTIAMAMQEELGPCLIAMAIIAASAQPAQAIDAMDTMLITPQTIPATLFISVSGIVSSFMISRALHHQLTNGKAMPQAPADRGSSSVQLSECKDWLAGHPLPSLQELSDACVIIATGPTGNWALCLTPGVTGSEFDGSCELDETFSAHYQQPVYICPV